MLSDRELEQLLTDLESVTKGEPPFQARKKYDDGLLETLATGGKVIGQGSTDEPILAPGAGWVSVQWVVALGVLLAISVLVNLALIATR